MKRKRDSKKLLMRLLKNERREKETPSLNYSYPILRINLLFILIIYIFKDFCKCIYGSIP